MNFFPLIFYLSINFLARRTYRLNKQFIKILKSSLDLQGSLLKVLVLSFLFLMLVDFFHRALVMGFFLLWLVPSVGASTVAL